MTGSTPPILALAVGALVLGLVAGGTPTETASSSGSGGGAGPTAEAITTDEGEPLDLGEAGPASQDPAASAGGASSPTATAPGGRQAATAQNGPGGKALECNAKGNGGATDVGISATRIKVASTVVLDGPAASLLRASPTAMRAVINKTNRAGGICGRQLDLTAVNDGFNAQTGQNYLRSFIDAKNFALPVVPSAEGLSTAITGGYIRQAGIPVVGTDGMRIEQYSDAWVWPVATATASTMRIMAKYGAEKHGAKTFAIVYDSTYRFGIEGANAFKEQVEAMGGKLKSSVPLNPERTSYSSEIEKFNNECKDGCDMVAMLLLPDAARTWMAGGPTPATLHTSAAQTLFSAQFAQQCVQVAGDDCNGITVWTGYNPPIGSSAALPGIAAYVDDVKAVDPGVDVQNQFVQGAYLGMSVFVEALKRVGPNLTRARLREELDRMTFESDLAPPLTWRPGNHNANGRARAFSIVVSQGTFTGWRDENTSFIKDPTL